MNNVIQGNRFANTLDGGKGIDTLIGGDGDDTYLVHHIRDVAKEGERGREPTGHDTVLAFNSVKLQRWIEDIHLQEVTGSTGDLVAGFTAIGNREDNTITGNATRNNLNGLFGNDTLTGNGGADDFIFSVALGAENVDTITDFTPGEDRIVLKAALLPGLGRGALDPALFHAGAGAAAGDHRLVWDGTTLWHDPDGSADTSPEAIATLLGAPTLTAADIWVA